MCGKKGALLRKKYHLKASEWIEDNVIAVYR
jgi:hypothetical protein